MKRFALIFLSLALTALFSTSCSEDEETQPTFDESLIIGTWQNQKNESIYEKYNDDKTGSTWDTADDVTEEEAQKFTWSIDKDLLIHIHKMESNNAVTPKKYTITDLTSTTMAYKDDYGNTESFIKQE